MPGRVGGGAREQSRWLAVGAYATACAVVVVAACTGIALGRTGPSFFAVVGLATAVVVFIDGVVVDRLDALAFAEHERDRVQRLLGVLAERGWHAIPDVVLGRASVQHLVIGPGGLFVVARSDAAGEVREQAFALEHMTGCRVEPLLVDADRATERDLATQDGITVLSHERLPDHLASRPHMLTAVEARALHARLTGALTA